MFFFRSVPNPLPYKLNVWLATYGGQPVTTPANQNAGHLMTENQPLFYSNSNVCVFHNRHISVSP